MHVSRSDVFSSWSSQKHESRYATSSINITLPEAGESESLSYGRTIAIDTTTPAVVNVTSTQPNGRTPLAR